MSQPCLAIVYLVSPYPEERDKVKTSKLTPQFYGASFEIKDEKGEEFFVMCMPKSFMDRSVVTIHSKEDITLEELTANKLINLGGFHDNH